MQKSAYWHGSATKVGTAKGRCHLTSRGSVLPFPEPLLRRRGRAPLEDGSRERWLGCRGNRHRREGIRVDADSRLRHLRRPLQRQAFLGDAEGHRELVEGLRGPEAAGHVHEDRLLTALDRCGQVAAADARFQPGQQQARLAVAAERVEGAGAVELGERLGRCARCPNPLDRSLAWVSACYIPA
jgi:hypothetical protein